MKTIALILLTVLSTAASATGGHNPPPPPVKPALTQAQVKGQDQDQAQRQAQDQDQAQSQVQYAAGGNSEANNVGNTQKTDVTFKDRLQAPSAHAPAVYAPNKCSSGWSLGVSAPGAGVSGGRTKINRECQREQDELERARQAAIELRENIKLAAELAPGLALKAVCRLPGLVEVASPADCEYKPAPIAPPPADSPPAAAPCRKALSQCVRK